MRSEIRLDEIHDRAVIIAPGRSQRPHDFHREAVAEPTLKASCVFCPENLRGVKSLTRVGSARHWRVNVIRNIFPVVSPKNPKAYGYQEVVVDTPEHNVEMSELPVSHVADILGVYGTRSRALMKDPKIGYILIFKNRGGRAGASIAHSHSQIFASEFIPPHINSKLVRAQAYRITHGISYYQHLIQLERGGPRWITETKDFVAFTPYASSYNYEAWIMPKRQIDNIALLGRAERMQMARLLQRLLARVSTLELPYNLYLHQNVRDRREHLYLRMAPRRDVWAGLELGSRLIVNTIAPEAAAKFYRTRS
ncbi:MAG: hypothetical protein HYZ09_03910 [Candidatus Kerfeldbacteria bacterium]|nr:hypothetical protein [Candidatus Kerfeldbacteria bacterium]